MTLAWISVRVDHGVFGGSPAARDVARLAWSMNSTGKDPRRGIRVILHLQRVGETPRESFVYRSTPHEMVRVDWPFFLHDPEEAVTAERLRTVLLDVARRVVDLGNAQGFVVDEQAVEKSLARITSAPTSARVVDHITTKCLQVLWTVRHGGGALDARQVDMQCGLRGGDVEGGIMPELKYLESEGLVTSQCGQIGSPRWSILPKGDLLVAEHEQFPRNLPPKMSTVHDQVGSSARTLAQRGESGCASGVGRGFTGGGPCLRA